MKKIVVSALGLASAAALAGGGIQDYPIRPVPFTSVRVQDSFWTPRLETNRLRTVWYDFQKCEETGRIDNFAKAGKLKEGPFVGTPFDDSDVFKVIEGAAYTLALTPDPRLDKYLDDLITKIAAAQERDGYLYTARTIDPQCRVDFFGPTRWSRLAQSHELYNVGHLYEAAVAHFEATRKRSLLEVAIKNADLICKTFGPGPGQLQEPPGHEEIEIGLVKLFRSTGQQKYLDQVKFFCDIRGRPETHKLRGPYQQDDKPIVDQSEPVGHAVRAGYFYSGVADVAAITGDQAFVRAIDRIWQHVVEKKLHLTGGIGASPGGEAFGGPYELPNASAYLETCAAIANALWNERMFLLHGEAKYLDVLERVIYNGFLSGVSLSGDRFFYPNPLEADGKRKFNHGSNERAPWFGCSCCPVNDVRFIPEIASFAYALRDDELFVNLYMGNETSTKIGDTPLIIVQKTDYPWDGKVRLTLQPAYPKEFTLNLRIPGWARNEPVPSDLYRYSDGLKPKVTLAVNNKAADLDVRNGFARLKRQWKSGDTLVLNFEMPPRRVVAHPAVEADRNRFAIERGPVVYCAEGADNAGEVLEHTFPGPVSLETRAWPNTLGGIVGIKLFGSDKGMVLNCIPYYAWCHRGPNEMRVWFPTAPEQKLVSHCWEADSVAACFDGKEPKSSNDHSIPRFTWWDHTGTAEWITQEFEKPRKVKGVSVYWFDDTAVGACRVPESWKLMYQDGEKWKPVADATAFGTAADQYNRVAFAPVTTRALRIEVQLQPKYSGGILEWKFE
jgi:uncharacterized protein